MRRAIVSLGCLSAVAIAAGCAGDGVTTQPVDASAVDDRNVQVDASADGPTDAFVADAADANIPIEPALWSHGYPNTTFRHFTKMWLAVDYTAGAKLGQNTLTGTGCYALSLNSSGIANPLSFNVTKASCGGAHSADNSYDYWVATIQAAGGYSTGDVHSAKNLTPSQPQTVMGALRVHAGPDGAMGLDSITDILSTSSNQLTKNGMGMIVPNDGFRATKPNTIPAVIDDIAGASGSSLIVAGRQDGSMYDYRFISSGPSPVSGGGFFVARYGAIMALQSVFLIGGTPLKPASDLTSGPDEGITLDNGCVAFAYTGTVDLGAGPLAAPSTGHAIVIGDILTNPSKPVAFSYAKGPASAGKTSTPHCFVTNTSFYFVDTIWDWISINGDVVKAVHANGDVIVASVDLTGKLVHARLYGGPGAVRGSGIVADGTGLVIAGQSDQGIDFGNGVLPGGAFVAKLPK